MKDEAGFAEEIAKLRQEVDGVILVAGSATLVQGLIEHDLLDELPLMVFPVPLGSGKRLFGETEDKSPTIEARCSTSSRFPNPSQSWS